jgi:hypothetical protein
MRKISKLKQQQQGSIIVTILIVTLFLSLVVSALVVLANSNLSRARGRVMLLQAQYSAESGADAAIAYLNSGATPEYTGTGASPANDVQVLSNSLYKSTYSSAVTAGSSGNERVVTVTGKVYRPASAAQPAYTRKIEVIAQRTSGSVAVAGMLSRNIIQFDSSVKDVYAKNLYVNGYIWMAKNTTNIIAENITAAGKNTGATNCSIGGVGNLKKPTSFSDPAQTKTNITMAFNNCITPPGNTTNANFTVLANQNTIQKVQSTYIPWSQFMDSSYLDASSCADWTTGSFPRKIPSTANSKKTHYPDSSSNVSATCGTSGDVSLGTGQYNITDNVHLRANLCAASGCEPKFYNPTAVVKYVFIEGTVNFNGVQSVAGSGPIVLVTYGADPASKAASCPLGGAMYMGNSGTVFAPAIYFLAVNGLCFDKTKFSGTPNWGGVSGKNIFFSSNPGTPFDPMLDSTFPFQDVPVDLSWHSARYRRL